MQMKGTDATPNTLVLLYDLWTMVQFSFPSVSTRRKEGKGSDNVAPRELLGSTPADEDATGQSGSDVGGARFGDNISRKDSRKGHRADNDTASFEGRERTSLGARAICFSSDRS